jgi:hypothetical protein
MSEFNNCTTLQAILQPLQNLKMSKDVTVSTIRTLASFPFDTETPTETFYSIWKAHAAEGCDPVRLAIEAGDLLALEWLRTNGFPVSDSMINVAAKHGHLSIVQWFYQKLNIGPDTECCEAAAEGGHLDIILWSYSLGTSMTMDIPLLAAINGHLPIVKWCCEMHLELSDDIGVQTILAGQFEVLKFLCENSYVELHHSMAIAACEVGRADILVWLIFEYDMGVGRLCMEAAAGRGNVEIMLILCGMNVQITHDVMVILEKKKDEKLIAWARTRQTRQQR